MGGACARKEYLKKSQKHGQRLCVKGFKKCKMLLRINFV